MSRPWMPLYIADYRADTTRLCAAEHGAYLLLIMEYWRSGSLPDDDRQLARITCMTDKEWKLSRKVIESFFQPGWKHKRIDEELAHAVEVSSKRRASAKLRGSNSSAIAAAIGDTLHTSPSEPKGSGEEPPEDLKADLFRRARKVFGKSSGGGLTAKLLRSIGPEDDPKTIAKARAAIEQSSTKANASEWIGRVIAGPSQVLDSSGQERPEGII